MISDNCIRLFRIGRLSEERTIDGSIIIYKKTWIVYLKRFFRKTERERMYNLIFDLYFEYEYTGSPLSARQISYLLWVHHSKIDNILKKNWLIIKNLISPANL